MRSLVFLISLILSFPAFAGEVQFTGSGSGTATIATTGSGTLTFGSTVISGDGVIGSSDTDSSVVRGANEFFYNEITPTTAGTVSYGKVYVQNHGTSGITIAIYSDGSTGNRLAYANTTVATNTAQWVVLALNTSVTLSAGVTYRIGVVSNDPSWNLYNDTSFAGGVREKITMTYATTPPATADFSSPGFSTTGDAFSVIFTNTAGTP